MIWKPKKLTREQMADRRKEGVRLLEQGKQSQAEIARNLDELKKKTLPFKR